MVGKDSHLRQWQGGIVLACSLFAACSQQPKSTQPAAPTLPAYYQIDPNTAGTITGKVMFTGKKRPSKKVAMDEDPQCAKLHASAVIQSAGGV